MKLRIALGVLIGVMLVAAVGGVLRELGDRVRRPEGAAERFLKAVSESEDGEIDRYGEAAVSRDLTAFTRSDPDEDFFRHIEVGRHADDEQPGAAVRVPYRVIRRDEGKTEHTGFLLVAEQPGDEPRGWKVVGDEPSAAARSLVPSQGGKEPASASGRAWLLAPLLALGIITVLEVLLRALRPPVARDTGQPGRVRV